MGIIYSRNYLLYEACVKMNENEALKLINEFKNKNYNKYYYNDEHHNDKCFDDKCFDDKYHNNCDELTLMIDNNTNLTSELKQRKNVSCTNKIQYYKKNNIFTKSHYYDKNNQNCTSIINYIDEKGNTPLMIACSNYMSTVALELIKTGYSNPSHVNKNGQTALILACLNNMSEVALELIKTGFSNPSHIYLSATALMLACHKNMPEVALELIKTGSSNPSHVNYDGHTALMFACSKNMKEVALELIKTGFSNPSHVNNNGHTALIFACSKNMKEVALELIKTGFSNPSHVNKNGQTAFEIACSNNMKEVALELIETNSNNIKKDVTELIKTKFISFFNNNDLLKYKYIFDDNFVVELLNDSNISIKMIENAIDLLNYILDNEFMESFKIILNMNININGLNEKKLLNFIERNSEKFNGKITNFYVIMLLCSKQKSNLIDNEILINYRYILP